MKKHPPAFLAELPRYLAMDAQEFTAICEARLVVQVTKKGFVGMDSGNALLTWLESHNYTFVCIECGRAVFRKGKA